METVQAQVPQDKEIQGVSMATKATQEAEAAQARRGRRGQQAMRFYQTVLQAVMAFLVQYQVPQ